MIITVANKKGGVGKTTIATLLTYVLVKKGKKVFAVDYDPLQNFRNFLENLREQRKVDIPCFDKIDPGKVKEVDFTIIDTPSRIKNDLLEKLFAVSDRLIIPFDPHPLALLGILSLLKLEALQRDKEKILLVLNKFNKKFNFHKSMLKSIYEKGLDKQYRFLVLPHRTGLFDIDFSLLSREDKETIKQLILLAVSENIDSKTKIGGANLEEQWKEKLLEEISSYTPETSVIELVNTKKEESEKEGEKSDIEQAKKQRNPELDIEKKTQKEELNFSNKPNLDKMVDEVKEYVRGIFDRKGDRLTTTVHLEKEVAEKLEVIASLLRKSNISKSDIINFLLTKAFNLYYK